MQGTLLSINQRLVRREERAGPQQSTVNAAQVSAAHECMLLAHRHPEVWPVLNEVSLRGHRSAVNWVAALEAIRLMLPAPQTATSDGNQLCIPNDEADISAC